VACLWPAPLVLNIAGAAATVLLLAVNLRFGPRPEPSQT
jgi:hypothetical protein